MNPITDFAQLDPTKTYSYADYLSWKFDEFVELVKGKVFRPMAGARTRHQVFHRRLTRAIGNFLGEDEDGCQLFYAPYDVRLTRSTGNGDAQIQSVVQPDILVVCDPTKIDERGCLGAPDWIIEIISPGNFAHDTRTKFGLYEENGVREYWLVNPGLNTVVAWTLDAAGAYQLAAEYTEPGPMPVATLPGLALEWAALFAGQ